MTKPYVVIGLGKTGLACAQFLKKQQLPFVVMDTRHEPPMLAEFKNLFPDVPVYLGGLLSDVLESAKTIVISPGLSRQTPEIAAASEKGVEICGDIELFLQFAKAPVVAVTGTNGKSTVVTLLGAMCEAAGVPAIVAGNIGTCVLDVLSWPTPHWYILELSSFQLETTYSLRAKVATILNITDDHMDRYDSLGSYAAAKLHIYDGAQFAVFNAEDPLTKPATSMRAVSFTSQVPRDNQYGIVITDEGAQLHFGKERLLAASEMKIAGLPNCLNALCALAMTAEMGLPRAACIQALRDFQGLPHRLQWVRSVQGVDWYNDSKGTNVGASVQAVLGLGHNRSGKLILIAGGQGKGADFSPMAQPVSQHCRAVILMGEDAPIIANALTNTAPIHHVRTLAAAIELAQQLAKPNDAVVLSPACASFDMFKNFEHRGECFVELVEQLA